MHRVAASCPWRVIFVLVLIGLLSAIAPEVAAGPVNPALEGKIGDPPAGWFLPGVVQQAGYAFTLVEDEQRGRAALLAEGRGFGNAMQTFDARPYRGRVAEFAAHVRVEAGSRAQLWMRVDREGEARGFFDNMGDRPITQGEWARYTIVGQIDEDAEHLSIGLMLMGGGRAWMSDVEFRVLDVEARKNQPPRALADRELENLVAFARALGYVRFYYPGDEAAQADFEKLAIRGIGTVEQARTPEELAAALRGVFSPIAPAFVIAVGNEPTPGALEAMLRLEAAPAGTMSWRHRGVGLSQAHQQIYSSRRVRGEAPEGQPSLPGRAHVRALAEGVWCVFPSALWVARENGAERTLPVASGNAGWAKEWEIGWRPSGDDRETRLGAVILAWTIFQHFYPYFDVVDVDWDEALRQALREAATDRDAAAFLRTLRRLVAKLEDGHGNVGFTGDDAGHVLPLALDIVEDRLVVTQSLLHPSAGPQRGDIVVSIGGRPWREAVAEAKSMISAATAGNMRWRVCQDLVRGPAGAVMIEVERDGQAATYRVQRVPPGPEGQARDPRPEKITEIRRGIWYVDIDRITDADFRNALVDLDKAKGIIFDLRGYPGRLSTIVISHLIDEPVTCAQWHIPMAPYPDREGMTFAFSNWRVQPMKPRLTSNAAFIIDGRAISYAETYMGIIEHYRLAEIVGEATAGTNGNVNSFALPGGYHVAFTGMKVLKHDGSRHHGIGNLPTEPVKRTIEGVRAGRDELLERAIKVVSD